MAGEAITMNSKILGPILFFVGLVTGVAGYHIIGKGAKDEGETDRPEARSGTVGSVLQKKEPVATPVHGGIAMPEGFEGADSIAEIMAKKGPRDRFQALMSHINGINTRDIEAALEEIRANMTNQFDPEAMFAMHMLMMRWGEEDSDAAFESLKKLDMMSRAFGSLSVLAAVASDDPNAAAAWLTDKNNTMAAFGPASEFMATTVSKEWAKTDVNAALEWAKTLPKGKRVGAYNGVIGSLASEDPQRASAMAMDLEPGKDRRNLVGNIAESWGKRSPTEALEWVNTMEEGDERVTAMSKTLGGWAQAEPTEAAAYLDQMEEAERADHVGAVAGPWSRQDPAGAAAWLDDQPEGDSKNDGMRQVMWMWTSTDPVAASTWLADQPEGPSRDSGIVSLASTTYNEDPAGAVAWSASISDENMRQEQVGRNMGRWVRDEPEAANEWIQGDGQQLLTPEEIERFVPAQDVPVVE